METGLVGKGLVMGTLMYAAPEVLARKGATTASDIYSLGVVMWELFTGRLPFGNVPGLQTQVSHAFVDAQSEQKQSGAHHASDQAQFHWHRSSHAIDSHSKLHVVLLRCMQSSSKALQYSIGALLSTALTGQRATSPCCSSGK